MEKILVIDIGGSSIKYTNFTTEGECAAIQSFDVPPTFDSLKAEIINLFKLDKYVGISISSPGSIDADTGIGYGLSAIDYIPCGGNLKQDLESELGVPVAIENDANCAGISEVYFSQDLDSVAYIVLGSGVGGCVINDGKVVVGSSFFGGEFGYIPYKDGTISAYAGMVGLSKRVSKADKQLNGVEIFSNYEQKIEPFYTAVRDYYDTIAHLIAIIKYTTNPQKIIFSGAVTQRQSFLEEVAGAVSDLSTKVEDVDIDDVEIMIGQFGPHANVYGAFGNWMIRFRKLLQN